MVWCEWMELVELWCFVWRIVFVFLCFVFLCNVLLCNVLLCNVLIVLSVFECGVEFLCLFEMVFGLFF